MNVSLVSFKPLEKELNFDLKADFARVYAVNWYIKGKEDGAFEKTFAEFCHTQNCVGVGNGLDR